MAWSEMAIVFVLSVFGYIVSTEVGEDNFEVVVEIKGEPGKLIEIDVGKTRSVTRGDTRQSQNSATSAV